ncbi:polysaccharide export outer membrane protein [Bizionia echini]|mgnify:CR=1 FL=1|uniref:Polysaccharide export outer membrane protein n=1 Tax=Bizionia echini TaxID=649333 RepID=A0A1I5AZT4_9FLAO|nr:polysaccharide biosynthesis/export family protein [Bizionia echini]MBP93381.1 sugar transporter [Flavobacteriaceae bacterium]SFN67954.1 polysaccharide export outer membrane protein [Bizionia echini]|tara:strand:- start:101 stop:883 length:783 start_codon:yes stop_codon:yes gene_type:complete
MINLKNIIKKTSLLVIIAAVSSCVTSKEIIYFQDEPVSEYNDIAMNSDIIYKPNDLIFISIGGDADAVAPFNLPAVSYSVSSVNANADLKMPTYLIDKNGNIEYPVLGTIKLGGLTREDATSYLKKEISKYVKDPVINIRLINFTITVLGEVRNPGTFTVEDERISLIEALGLAGDLTIYGKRENVFLIRERDGKKVFTKFDLTKISTISSPNYYLEQNDVLVIEPNSAKIRSASYNQNNGVIISAVGTLATILAIFLVN